MTRLLMRAVLITVCMLVALARPASSAVVDSPKLDSAVNRNDATTYLDLARHFVPDIKPENTGYIGKTLIPVRHILTKEFTSGDADGYGFYSVSTVTMHADGKRRLLVLFDLAEATQSSDGVAILALYDVSKGVRLLDAADIGFQQSTNFADHPLMPVAPGSDVVLTTSTHFNSNQTYTTHAMIMVRSDRLELVDTAFMFDERLCAGERRQQIRYAAKRAAGRQYATITALVTETDKASDADCSPDPRLTNSIREIRVTYHWDAMAGKYVRDSDALEKLAKANEERF